MGWQPVEGVPRRLPQDGWERLRRARKPREEKPIRKRMHLKMQNAIEELIEMCTDAMPAH